MALIENFLKDIDSKWKPLGGEPFPLQIIGSAALMLQTDYIRGTKDSDVLESRDGSPGIKEQLEALAGKKTDLHLRHGLYIDVVKEVILFLPPKPIFLPIAKVPLKNFNLTGLDVTDVVLSKLKRFNADDLGDIRAMATRRLIDHQRLVARFRVAAEWFGMDARASPLPRTLKNLHTVEREILDVPLSDIELPEAMG